MKPPITLKMKLILVLLAAESLLKVITLFSFFGIDNLINEELPKYGLQLSQAWISLYQNQSNMFLIYLYLSLFLIVVLITAVLWIKRKYNNHLSLAEFIIPSILLGMNIFLIFNLTSINHLIHTNLYSYGLQFSAEWASPLFTYTVILFTLIGISSFIMIIIIINVQLILQKNKIIESVKTNTEKSYFQTIKLAPFILIISGSYALILAIFFFSSVLALIGIGLVFWGVLFLYICKEENKKSNIVNMANFQQIKTMNQIIDELNFEGKPIYLPPKYFTDPEIIKVYVSKKQEFFLPKTQQIQKQESRIFIKKPAALLLTPIGVGLVKLLEKELDTNFARVDLQYLKNNLPKKLIEDLEIVQNMKIIYDKNQITVIIEYFTEILSEKGQYIGKQEFQTSLNIILISAITCILTKTIGNPIIVRKQEISNNGRKEIVEYETIDKEEKQ